MKNLFLMPLVGIASLLAGLFIAALIILLCVVVVPILASIALIKAFVVEPFKNLAYA